MASFQPQPEYRLKAGLCVFIVVLYARLFLHAVLEKQNAMTVAVIEKCILTKHKQFSNKTQTRIRYSLATTKERGADDMTFGILSMVILGMTGILTGLRMVLEK